MSLGTLGSTLSDELNRLANGGTYRDMDDMVDEALAAKQWANRENISPYTTDTVGVLNEIAGLGTNRQNWLDFNGVCNYIAGTSGLPAAAALRQIYPTTDLLTGVASYYVDAATPLGSSNSGYVYLNGSAGNFISTPDAAALDIVGDIDLRAYIAPDTWIPATASTIVSKWLSTGNQRSFRLQITTTGLLSLAWTSDGATGTLLQVNSTVATGLLNTQVKWVRATLDVNNGAGGYDVAFYTSDDGSSWTQLGTTVTSAGTASIYSGTANVEIGSLITGTTENLAAKVFRVQVLNGIGGTTVLDADCSVVTSQSQTSFTATTGQTMTIAKTSEQVNVLTNLGTAGALLPTTVGSSTAADSNDPKFLDHTGTNYVYLPGAVSNYLFVPDSAALDITGDIDLRMKIAADDWTDASSPYILSKLVDGNKSYAIRLLNTGVIRLQYSADGTADIAKDSTVATGLTDGTVKWIRATLDVDNGASGNDVKFFLSDDGITWTQLGSTVTTAGTTSIYAGTADININGRNGGLAQASFAGKIYRAQILDGIDGTTVLDVDTSVITAGSATSFTAVTGQTVTINRSTSGRKTVAVTQPTWLFGTDDYMEVNNRYMAHSGSNYLYLPGVTGNVATAPDSAALDITGDIDLRVKVALDDWTPAATNVVLSKRGTGLDNISYGMQIDTNGRITFFGSNTGTDFGVLASSTVSPTVADGATKWVRVTLDVDNGAGGKDFTFFTSDDGSIWTQLGTTVTQAGTTSLFSGNAVLSIGGTSTISSGIARGKFFRAMIYSDLTETTLAFDADFETGITSLLQTTFTESSLNAATVTINRSGSAYRSAGITQAGYLYPGATNTFAASATDFLNFGESDSFTALAVLREFATPTSNQNILAKYDASRYWYLRNQGTAANLQTFLFDGTNTPGTAGPSFTLGGLITNAMVVNRTTQTVSIITNGVSGSTASISSLGSVSNVGTFRISNLGGGGYADMELIGAAVFRTVLTATQIRQIVNYFANREVYL